MLILDEAAVRGLLDMGELIAAMERALADLSSGKVVQPVRTMVPVAEHAAPIIRGFSVRVLRALVSSSFPRERAMPIYAYRCTTCGHAKDVLQKVSDPLLTECPACGAATFAKQVTAAGFQLKGSGWYVTDFRGGGNSAGGKAEGDGGADKGGGEKAAEKGTTEGGDKGKASTASTTTTATAPTPAAAKAPAPAASAPSPATAAPASSSSTPSTSSGR